VVVDLAIQDDPHALILVGHGLGAPLEVHDREAPVAEADRPLDPQSLAVRPAMAQDVPHPLEPRLVDGLERIQADDADDPAHTRTTPRSPTLTLSPVSSNTRPTGSVSAPTSGATFGTAASGSDVGRSSVTMRSGG